jgi:HAD superfamily hydrolase (TIGR01484 family)
MSKLAIFDLDGTIALGGKVVPSVLQAIDHLHELGYLTTISSGRGYSRLRQSLGDDFDRIISPEALIILEHGCKIVDHDGSDVFAEYFADDEIKHVVDFVRANSSIFSNARFNPSDVSRLQQVWCFDERDVQAVAEERRGVSDVFHGSIGQLRAALQQQKLASVSMTLKPHIKVENLRLVFTRTATNVIFQDGLMDFVKSNTNKGLAVRYVARELGVVLPELLVAGNAINDVEMLDLGAAHSILVAQGEVRHDILSYLSAPETIIHVDTPHDLGQYLLKL